MQLAHRPERQAFAIFIDTICEGRTPAWHNDRGYPVTYSTEREAQLEIVDDVMERLRQFLAGERDFDDAVAIEDYILPIDLWPDGSITTEDGQRYGQRE